MENKNIDLLESGYLGAVAIITCNSEYIGQDIYFQIPDETDMLGPFLAVGCVNILDIYPMIYNTGFALEVDFETAVTLGFVSLDENGKPQQLRGNIPIYVSLGGVPEAHEKPVDLQSWFL